VPANPETRRRAEEALRSLESHWISLLRWLALSLGLSDDDFLAGWKSDVYLTSRDRLEKDSRGLPEAPWTVLNYLDFGRYPELAGTGEYGRKLEQLGSPPRNWKAVLDELNSRGCIQYRNHLSHGGRFDALPVGKQEVAAGMFVTQRDLLKSWWPEAPFSVQRPIPEESPYRTAIRLLSADPNSAASLVEQLGMRFVANAPDLLTASVATPLFEALGRDFGALHRVGEADLEGVNAAVYLAYLPEWPMRSSEREKSRRKLAKALIEHQVQDPRWLAVLMDGTGKAGEAEFIVPRQRTGKAFGTIRASVSLLEPNRYHVDLLSELKLRPDVTLPEISRQWNQALSVERVTKRFYDEFRELRDRIIKALLEKNADNPAIAGKDREEDKVFNLQLHAFGTRQLGRMLFLWFIQQKRWLGGSAGDGETDFILTLFRDNTSDGDGFYNDVLLPIFFEGLGLPIHHGRHRAVEARFGPLPFLGGGLFRAGADQFEGELFGLEPDGTRRNRISLPDDLFDPVRDSPSEGGRPSLERTVLGLLRGYRFTTQESTPDDQSVDPDPELLGKVFENLYQGDDRHDTGAYYTPREIVHFMCRQALDGYLRPKAEVDQETLDWLREEALDWTVSDRRLTPAQHSALVEALDDVKIVDPAVGSGAFLVASVQEIVLLRRGIQQSSDDRDVRAGSPDVADWKRRTITNCLYGVDINPMAVEICHLRLWLSMVVDLDVSDYHHIPSLPNLDLRVVAGDSLIDRMGEERFVHSLGGDGGVQANFETVDKVGRLLTEIERLQHHFTGEGVHDPMRLVAWRNDIRHKQMEIAQIQLDDSITRASDATEKLKRNPKTTQKALRGAQQHAANLQRLRDGLRDDAPYQKPFLWPVNFPEIFERGGFDIVVANPPYISHGKLDRVDQESYRCAFPDVFTGSADILVCFYSRAVQLLGARGQISFITSNKYMRVAYGEKLRSFLPTRLCISGVYDFGDLPLFAVSAYPAVVTAERVPHIDPSNIVPVANLAYPIRKRLKAEGLASNVENVRGIVNDLPDLLAEATVHQYEQRLLRPDGWVLEAPAIIEILDHMKRNGSTFESDHGRATYRGITTGLNDAFVIDDSTRNQIVRRQPVSDDIIKRWYRGQDVRRWIMLWAGLWVIFTRRGTDIKKYRTIRDHLGRWRRELEPKQPNDPEDAPGRKPGDYKWFEIQDSSTYYHEMERPKVVWAKTTYRPAFAYDTSSAHVGNTVHFVAGAEPWLAAVLNSSLMEFVYLLKTNLLRGGYLELTPERLKPLPMPILSTAEKQRLNELGGLAELADEQEIDSLVAGGFDLSTEQVSEIAKWLERRAPFIRDEDTTPPSDDDDD
jgi:adenine-specific DNA-methyltransferase